MKASHCEVFFFRILNATSHLCIRSSLMSHSRNSWLWKVKKHMSRACTDPESFYQGGGGGGGRAGPNQLTSFKLMRGERIQLPLKVGHLQLASKTPFNMPFCWGTDDGLVVCSCQGDQISIAIEPYNLKDFPGVGGPFPSPSG